MLIQEDTWLSARISRQYGHAFLRWAPTVEACFTEPELRRLNRRFGHRHSTKLHDRLRRADFDDVSSDALRIFQEIERLCHHCQRFGPAPRWFKFNIREDLDLNHSVYVDVFYIKHPRSTSSTPVLHVVDEATRFQDGLRLLDLRAETVWRALRRCWMDNYLAPRTSSSMMLAPISWHDHFRSKMASSSLNVLLCRLRLPMRCPMSRGIIKLSVLHFLSLTRSVPRFISTTASKQPLRPLMTVLALTAWSARS